MAASPTAEPAPKCTQCGALLVSRTLPDGSVVIGDLKVPFRRETDFVVCQRCLATFRAEDIRAGLPRPV